MSKNSQLLQLRKVWVDYGKLTVLKGVNFDLRKSEIVALMGPNGAGKSTILKAIFGLTKVVKGEIFWKKEMLRPHPHKMAEVGIAYVPQGRAVFGKLTVQENLEMGGVGIKDEDEVIKRIEEVYTIFPMLKEKKECLAKSLSGGEQQILAIGRGLMTRPRLLLLDEPSLGLAPKTIKEVFAKIKEINSCYRIAIIIVEHNIRSALAIADRVYVLRQGQVAFEGRSNDVHNSVLKEVFLGKV